MKSFAEGLHAIALTLWIGAIWTVGYLVAPLLFSMLHDTAQAGAVAGRLFSWVSYIGIGCGAYLLLFRLMRFGASSLEHAIFWILLLMLCLVVVGEFGVQPVLSGLKSRALPKEVMESVLRDRFVVWHGVASGLYVIQSVLGLVLIWLQGRNPR